MQIGVKYVIKKSNTRMFIWDFDNILLFFRKKERVYIYNNNNDNNKYDNFLGS